MSSVPPTAARWRPIPRTLAGKLTVGVVALVFVVVAAAGVGTYVALRSFLYARLDQQLQTTASSSVAEAFDRNNRFGGPVGQRVWAVALTDDGTVLGGPITPSVYPMKLSPADQHRLAVGGAGPLTLRTTDGEELRVTAVRNVAFNLGPLINVRGIAVVGLSTDDPTHVLERLVVLEVIIGAAAVVLAAVATSWGVRFSLRNLYRVTQTAQEVSAELSPEGTGLDRRVEVVDPDTEVGTLAESLNTLLATVETQFAARVESEDRMRQFLADASHELRTPLTSIRGYAELARMQGRAEGEEAADSLARIESEGTRMSRLVDDLLTLARSDQGARPVHEVVDLDEVFGDVLDQVKVAYPDRPVTVAAEEGLTVVGDQDQILRVLRNLVANAAAYTRAGGPIEMRAAPDGAGVRIEVLDSGPGLPTQDAAHVFERFWRADKARTRASGGSGLGLSIVASIVHAHGGTVRFDSAVETGSTVTVWLPATTG